MTLQVLLCAPHLLPLAQCEVLQQKCVCLQQDCDGLREERGILLDRLKQLEAELSRWAHPLYLKSTHTYTQFWFVFLNQIQDLLYPEKPEPPGSPGGLISTL